MVIGITGAIGAGKSLACSYISKKYSFAVLNEDMIAKEIMNRQDVRQALMSCYGSDIYNNDQLDVNKLRGKINDKGIDDLNKIVHPEVFSYVEDAIKDNENYIIETALPKEARLADLCDYIIIINRDYADRIKSATKERGITKDQFDALDSRQTFDFDFQNKYTIINDSNDENQFYKNIDNIMEKIVKEWLYLHYVVEVVAMLHL